MNKLTKHQKLFGIILGAPIIFLLTVIKLIVMASAHTHLVLVFDEKCPTKKIKKCFSRRIKQK